MFAVFAGDLVLIRDVDYFGRDIRRGSIFRLVSGTNDRYRLYENKDGVVMECPAVQVHFSSVHASHFQEVFQSFAPVRAESAVTVVQQAQPATDTQQA